MNFTKANWCCKVCIAMALLLFVGAAQISSRTQAYPDEYAFLERHVIREDIAFLMVEVPGGPRKYLEVRNLILVGGGTDYFEMFERHFGAKANWTSFTFSSEGYPQFYAAEKTAGLEHTFRAHQSPWPIATKPIIVTTERQLTLPEFIALRIGKGRNPFVDDYN